MHAIVPVDTAAQAALVLELAENGTHVRTPLGNQGLQYSRVRVGKIAG